MITLNIGKKTALVFLILVFVGIIFTACASQQEYNTTWDNRQKINSAIPVPALDFSTRRLVLAKYYLVLERQRLNTCSMFSGRGNSAEAIIPTFGPSVNLSNQMTSGTISEPDSVYVGPNDQTLAVLRNGNFVTAELDVITVGGDCPAGVRSETTLQKMLEFASNGIPEFNFTNTDGLKAGSSKGPQTVPTLAPTNKPAAQPTGGK